MLMIKEESDACALSLYRPARGAETESDGTRELFEHDHRKGDMPLQFERPLREHGVSQQPWGTRGGGGGEGYHRCPHTPKGKRVILQR